MLTRRVAMFSAAAAALLLAASSSAAELNLPREKVALVAPPFVHAHEQATKQGPKIMEFRLVIEEKKMVIDAKGTTFQAMTFNGSMPGPLMVVHEGDYVSRSRWSIPRPIRCRTTSTSTPRPARSAAAR
jgi:nitrite reductase (NO-forming)